MKNLKKLSIEYFELFSNKDIEKLKEMFDSSINLRDWEINARGIEEVITANLNIFNSTGAGWFPVTGAGVPPPPPESPPVCPSPPSSYVHFAILTSSVIFFGLFFSNLFDYFFSSLD